RFVGRLLAAVVYRFGAAKTEGLVVLIDPVDHRFGNFHGLLRAQRIVLEGLQQANEAALLRREAQGRYSVRIVLLVRLSRQTVQIQAPLGIFQSRLQHTVIGREGRNLLGPHFVQTVRFAVFRIFLQ